MDDFSDPYAPYRIRRFAHLDTDGQPFHSLVEMHCRSVGAAIKKGRDVCLQRVQLLPSSPKFQPDAGERFGVNSHVEKGRGESLSDREDRGLVVWFDESHPSISIIAR